MGKHNSKFEKFKELKFLNPSKLYIFENGVFYISYNEDADKMKDVFGFVVKQMGSVYRKCEFPVQYFERYEKALQLKRIDYEVIAISKRKKKIEANALENSSSECSNLIHLEIIQMIQKVELSKITPIQAINLLLEMQNRIKNSK